MALYFWVGWIWVAMEVETEDRVKIGVDVKVPVGLFGTRSVLGK